MLLRKSLCCTEICRFAFLCKNLGFEMIRALLKKICRHSSLDQKGLRKSGFRLCRYIFVVCVDRRLSVILACTGIDCTARLPNGEPKRRTSSIFSSTMKVFHAYTKNTIGFNFSEHQRVLPLVSIKYQMKLDTNFPLMCLNEQLSIVRVVFLS